MTQREDDQHTADQYTWHMQAINAILDRWRHGDLTTYEKRKAISDENKRYYGEQVDPLLARTGRRYELPAVLADANGIPEDVMTMALNARRHEGVEAYGDVLAAFRGRP